MGASRYFGLLACKFLKTLKANERLRASTSTFGWIAFKAILEATGVRRH